MVILWQGITTLGQGRPEINGSKEVLYTLQITKALNISGVSFLQPAVFEPIQWKRKTVMVKWFTSTSKSTGSRKITEVK